jgi:Flp pilus assembly pilin Flp
MSKTMRSLLQRARAVRLLTDDDGQDLIEYALLTGLVVVGGLLVFTAAPFVRRMGDAYLSWNTNTQSLWVPPPPM